MDVLRALCDRRCPSLFGFANCVKRAALNNSSLGSISSYHGNSSDAAAAGNRASETSHMIFHTSDTSHSFHALDASSKLSPCLDLVQNALHNIYLPQDGIASTRKAIDKWNRIKPSKALVLVSVLAEIETSENYDFACGASTCQKTKHSSQSYNILPLQKPETCLQGDCVGEVKPEIEKQFVFNFKRAGLMGKNRYTLNASSQSCVLRESQTETDTLVLTTNTEGKTEINKLKLVLMLSKKRTFTEMEKANPNFNEKCRKRTKTTILPADLLEKVVEAVQQNPQAATSQVLKTTPTISPKQQATLQLSPCKQRHISDESENRSLQLSSKGGPTTSAPNPVSSNEVDPGSAASQPKSASYVSLPFPSKETEYLGAKNLRTIGFKQHSRPTLAAKQIRTFATKQDSTFASKPSSSSLPNQSRTSANKQGRTFATKPSETSATKQGGTSTTKRSGISITKRIDTASISKQGRTSTTKDGETLTTEQSGSLTTKQADFSTQDGTKPTKGDGTSETKQEGSSTTKKGGSSLTKQGGSSTTKQGGSSETKQGGSSTTKKGRSSTTKQVGSSTTKQGGSSTTKQGGSSATKQRGSSTMNQSEISPTKPQGRTIVTKQSGTVTTEQSESSIMMESESLSNKQRDPNSIRHSGTSVTQQADTFSAIQNLGTNGSRTSATSPIGACTSKVGKMCGTKRKAATMKDRTTPKAQKEADRMKDSEHSEAKQLHGKINAKKPHDVSTVEQNIAGSPLLSNEVDELLHDSALMEETKAIASNHSKQDGKGKVVNVGVCASSDDIITANEELTNSEHGMTKKKRKKRKKKKSYREENEKHLKDYHQSPLGILPNYVAENDSRLHPTRKRDTIYNLTALFSGKLGAGSKTRTRNARPNYFYAVQITNPRIKEGLAEVLSAVENADAKLTPAFVKPSHAHLTLVAIHLADQADIDRAKQILDWMPKSRKRVESGRSKKEELIENKNIEAHQPPSTNVENQSEHELKIQQAVESVTSQQSQGVKIQASGDAQPEFASAKQNAHLANDDQKVGCDNGDNIFKDVATAGIDDSKTPCNNGDTNTVGDSFIELQTADTTTQVVSDDTCIVSDLTAQPKAVCDVTGDSQEVCGMAEKSDKTRAIGGGLEKSIADVCITSPSQMVRDIADDSQIVIDVVGEPRIVCDSADDSQIVRDIAADDCLADSDLPEASKTTCNSTDDCKTDMAADHPTVSESTKPPKASCESADESKSVVDMAGGSQKVEPSTEGEEIPDHLLLQVKGLGTFNNKVVFAEVSEGAALDHLVLVSDYLRTSLREQNLAFDARKFAAHVTIMKMSKNFQELRKKGVKQIDQTTYQAFMETIFGNQPVESIQLCSMEKPKQNGYYHIEYEVQL